MQGPVPEWDVVVFGAGAGGMTAALVAAREGLRVALCEASAQVGGTTATSAGTVWIPGNHASLAAGFDDSAQEAAAYLDALIGPSDRARRMRYLAAGPESIDYLERHTPVQFAPAGMHPDYIGKPGAAVAGRALSPRPFDGRELGRDFARIRPPLPEFMLLGGMMVGKTDIEHLVNRFRSWTSFRHSAKLVLRYAADRLRYPRGTRLVMGNALVARLFAGLRARGVDLLFETRLAGLATEGARVCGAWVEQGGERRLLRARRGVVLATGGINRHPAHRPGLMPSEVDDLPSLVFDGNCGEGIEAGTSAGAALAGSGMLWQPVSRTGMLGKGLSGLFPHLFLDRAKPGLIAVDAAGRRFTNEAASYHHFCAGMLRAQPAAVPCWLICDAAFVRRYGLGLVPPETHDPRSYAQRGYLRCADTLAELAQHIGVPSRALETTVRRHNMHAATGRDPDHGKGEAEVDRFNGDAQHRPNPCIGGIVTAPFCALQIWPADAAASRGLATDEAGAVLDTAAKPIPGLYACGNDMASIMGGHYPGPGITLGPALVFGYLIGRSLAA
jgi:glycine/D-amino acid oxidase-like deaminating enzyme